MCHGEALAVHGAFLGNLMMARLTSGARLRQLRIFSWSVSCAPGQTATGLTVGTRLLHAFLGGQKKHMNFFNINFWPPPKPPFWAPRKKFVCLVSWERTQKRDPHKLFRGDCWGQKRGPKRGIFGHKKFGLVFFSCPNFCVWGHYFRQLLQEIVQPGIPGGN